MAVVALTNSASKIPVFGENKMNAVAAWNLHGVRWSRRPYDTSFKLFETRGGSKTVVSSAAGNSVLVAGGCAQQFGFAVDKPSAKVREFLDLGLPSMSTYG